MWAGSAIAHRGQADHWEGAERETTTVAITAPTDCASINTAGLMDALRRTDRAWRMTRDPDAEGISTSTSSGWMTARSPAGTGW